VYEPANTQTLRGGESHARSADPTATAYFSRPTAPQGGGPEGEGAPGGCAVVWVDEERPMLFVFTIKTKNGGIVTNINVDARDQKEAEERVKKENPTCTITKVEKK
jgi:hypothetical protein